MTQAEFDVRVHIAVDRFNGSEMGDQNQLQSLNLYYIMDQVSTLYNMSTESIGKLYKEYLYFPPSGTTINGLYYGNYDNYEIGYTHLIDMEDVSGHYDDLDVYEVNFSVTVNTSVNMPNYLWVTGITLNVQITGSTIPPTPTGQTAYADFSTSFNSTPWTTLYGSFNWTSGGTHDYLGNPIPAGLGCTSVYSYIFPYCVAVMYYNQGTWTTNQSASTQVDYFCLDEDYDSIGPAINIQPDGEFYAFYVTNSSNIGYLFYQSPYEQVVYASQGGLYMNSGDTISISNINGMISGYINGVLICQYHPTDHVLIGGKPGIDAFAFYGGPTDPPDSRLRNWNASNI